MLLEFTKWEGAGNDFIIIDNRKGAFLASDAERVRRLCDRRFGIGADGLMLLQSSSGADFAMRYFNSDGNESTMCGNGGRCIAKYADMIGIKGNPLRFEASDGIHQAVLLSRGQVRLQMKDIEEVNTIENGFFLDTGSPHFVIFTNNLADLDVYTRGRQLRNDPRFQPQGTNVNFVQEDEKGLSIRTYERGVEAETLACGTGAVASAACYVYNHSMSGENLSIRIHARGGDLAVSLTPKKGQFTDVWLTGPARIVYQGTYIAPVL